MRIENALVLVEDDVGRGRGLLGLGADARGLVQVDQHILDALGAAIDHQPLRNQRRVLGADIGVLGRLAFFKEDLGSRRITGEGDLALEGAEAFGLDRRGRRRRWSPAWLRRRKRSIPARQPPKSWPRDWNSRSSPARPLRRSIGALAATAEDRGHQGDSQAQAQGRRFAHPARRHRNSPGVFTQMLVIRQIRGPETEPAFPSPRRSGEGILRRTEFIRFSVPLVPFEQQIDQRRQETE